MSIIIGTNASETINGTNQADIITGGNGNDVLNGDAGTDIIDGGNGNDTINGGAGSDLLAGGNGDDRLDGGSGSDLLAGGNGKDTLIYRAAENIGAVDIYDGGNGEDTLRLIVTQALASSAAFQADIAALQARLAHGSASYAFHSIDLVVTSIEKLEVVVEGGTTNHAPVAVADTVNATEDTTLTILAASLLANDTDADSGDTKTLVSVQAAQHGTVSINSSGNVVFVADTNYSGVASFTYTMKDTAGATSTATVTVNVAAVADAPTLTVAAATGSEDSPISLSIAPALTDADGSEHLSALVVSAIPVGATLADGNGHSFTAEADNTSVDINGWNLSSLTIKPAANSDADFTLHVVATSQEGASGPTASTSADLVVTVSPVADAPTLTVAAATGNEDTPIALSIAPALTDADGSEHLSALVVSAIPVGATLSDGTQSFTATAGSTSVDINGWTLSSLTIKAPANSDADFTLHVVATSQEGTSGPTASTSATINVVVDPVADAPSVTTTAASGTTDAPIPLSIAITLTDPSESLGSVVEIDGVPSSFTLNHGSPSDDGGYLVQVTDLGSLQLVPIADQAKPGAFTLHVTATSADGSDVATTTASLDVTVDAGVTQSAGRVVDGYVVGATVFADANGNGQLDTGEAFTTTAADGTFVLTGGTGDLVMFGGTDVSTGLAFTGTMMAPAGSTVVTPLTTLVAAIAASSGSDVAAAQSAVAAAFGLDPGIDLQTFDPVPQAISGDPAATAVLSAALQVQSTVSQVSAVTGSTTDVFNAIAGAITTAGGTVDLSNSSTVTAIAADSGVTGAALSVVTDVVTAAVGTLQSATDVTGLAQAATVAQGDATAALAATDFNDSGQVAALTQTYVTNIDTQVANAEVGDVDGPLVGTLGADNLVGTIGVDAIDGLDGDDMIEGATGNDLLYGGAGRDQLGGGFGDDLIDGGDGFDRAFYGAATDAINVQLAAGIVTGGQSVGTDTLRSIEGVIGSGQADTFDATSFTATSTNGGGLGITTVGGNGPAGSVNEFEGMGGDDQITGNGNTRISYQHAVDGVTVNLATHSAHGTAAGDVANVGNDNLIGGIGQVRGSDYVDSLTGSNTTLIEQFEGLRGDDFINGAGGLDRARYDSQNTGALGIIVDLGAGTVTGRDAAATAVVGHDTLRGVESIRGSNAADIFDASTFTASSTNGGADQGNFNEFEGMGGDDQIIGNGNTRIAYVNATSGVTINNATGNAAGDGSVGHDTFTGVTQLRGSNYNDTITGANNAANTTENFEGWAGDDLLTGGGGFDRARYDNSNTTITGIPLTLGVQIAMASGIVTGRDAYAAFIFGTDTLRGIESVRGTTADDIYDATGLTTSSLNAGETGANNLGQTLNEFEGMAGNDTITGNGNTRITFVGATEGVTVNLATGTVVGGASVGNDTILGGVNQVRGSGFVDIITGSGVNDTLDGQGGNDTINGGGGNDNITGGTGNDTINGGVGLDIATFSGTRTSYWINPNTAINGTPQVGATQVIDNRSGAPDGTDQLTNVELMRFTDAFVMGTSTLNLSGFTATSGATLFGTNNVDALTIGLPGAPSTIDLAGGTDTLTLASSGIYTLNLSNVEVINSTNTGPQTLNLLSATTNMSITLGNDFNDTLNLANGTNIVSVANVEIINGGGGIDTVTIGTGVTTVTTVKNVENVFGSGGMDNITLSADPLPLINANFDLGGGTDSVTLNVFGTPTINLGLTNVETVNSTGGSETVNLLNALNGTIIDLGGGFDTLNLGNGNNTVTVSNVEVINSFGATNNDNVTVFLDPLLVNQSINLGAGTDTLTLAGASGNFSISVAGGNLTVFGATSIGDEHINLLNTQAGTTFDLGGGADDSLTLFNGGGFNVVTVKNVETVTGSNGSDQITIANTSGTTTVTGGWGADLITASDGDDHFRYTSVSDSAVGGGLRDTVINFDAAHDQFFFEGMSGGPNGFQNPVNFVGINGFDGGGVSEARLADIGGATVLQIDVDGDGVLGGNDMEIGLTNLTGTLNSQNFLLI